MNERGNMPNEYAKLKPPLLDKLCDAINAIQDGVSLYQTAVDELVDYGQRLRTMTDRLQARAIDDDGALKIPSLFTRANGETTETKAETSPKSEAA